MSTPRNNINSYCQLPSSMCPANYSLDRSSNKICCISTQTSGDTFAGLSQSFTLLLPLSLCQRRAFIKRLLRKYNIFNCDVLVKPQVAKAKHILIKVS